MAIFKTTPSARPENLPGELPTECVAQDQDLSALPSLLKSFLEDLRPEHFVKRDPLWRDWLCMTGSIRTSAGADTISQAWSEQSVRYKPSAFQAQSAMVTKPAAGTSWASVPFTFRTDQEDGLNGECSGAAAMIPDDQGGWKIWTLTTMLEAFEGHGNPDIFPAGKKARSSGMSGDTNGINGYTEGVNGHTNGSSAGASPTKVEEYSVAIVGGGQNGLSVGGRLAALGISYVIVDKKPRVGDSWTDKYDTVKQHTIREYNNLPFDRTWNEDDPHLLPAWRVSEGHRSFVEKYGINIWTSSEVRSCARADDADGWALEVDRSGEKRSLRCRHLVLAVGAGLSVPRYPSIPGQDAFKGELMHAFHFKNSKKWAGKKAIVIGSGTTAHDVCQDMLNNGLSSVTMIQRTKTAIFPVEWHIDELMPIYNTSMPTEISDRILQTGPYKVGREIMAKGMRAQAEVEHERFDALERAGFGVDREAIMLDNIFVRYGGYYIDVGTSKQIANGNIKIKSGVPIESYTANGLRMEDGTELEADVIMICTGYNSDARMQAAEIIGEEAASQLNDFWGLDEEGEVRGLMKPVAPHLWMVAGAAPHARFYSRFYALQIQADLMGKPLPRMS